MLTVTLVRVVIGFAVLGLTGVALALGSQLLSMWFVDNRLEVRDQQRFERTGWPERTDFPVMGQPGWQNKIHQMRSRTAPAKRFRSPNTLKIEF